MRSVVLLFLFPVLGCLAAPALGDVLRLDPVQSAVCPADSTGITKVALQFDLSGIRSGENRQIEEAILDWTVAAMDDETDYVCVAYRITSGWTEAGVTSNGAPESLAEAAAEWTFGPADYDALGMGMVRFYLEDLVEAWVAGEAENHGVLIEVPGLTAEGVSAAFGHATLIVRYGFRPSGR